MLLAGQLNMASQILVIVSTFLFGVFVSNFQVLAAPQPAKASNLILEGDIVVTPNLNELISETRGSRVRRSVVKDKIKLWKHARVPYTIDPQLRREARKAIRHAIREFKRRTCVEFTPRKNEEDYVAFVRDIGCFSPIGRQGGRQRLSVGEGCEYKGIMIHEMMHAIGFFHEHTRPDRDQYIIVLWWNIEPGKERNFESYSHDTVDTLGERYDYGSIMHYSNKDYSINGDNTIQALHDPGKKLGQMEDFSDNDLTKIRKVYGCDKLPSQPKRKKKRDHCKDRLKGCAKYAVYNGYCHFYKSFMAKYCKKSCDFCDSKLHLDTRL